MKKGKEHIVYLSLGSNVEPRAQTLQEAIDLIAIRYEGQKKLFVSPIYESEAWGFETEMKFLNLCIEAHTKKTAQEILEINQLIEIELGRKPKKSTNYESRPIDIDILFFDNQIISTHDLKVPHPNLAHRKFVLYPLKDIANSYLHPILKKSITELLNDCEDESELNKHKDFNE